MCLYCFNHVKENLNGQCPACRTEYEDSNYRFKPEPEKKRKEKKDPAVKEAEMAAQAQSVARQQAQLRADMIARAKINQEANQRVQAAAGNPAAKAAIAERERKAALEAAQTGKSDSGGGSWAAMATGGGGAPSGPPPPSSQAWPSLGGGGSVAPTQANHVGDVDDWESLEAGETVPSLDDAKNDAQVQALLRQVAELQKKLQDAQLQLSNERTTREAASEKCVTIRSQQISFDAELMSLATRFQLESQAESEQMMGLDGLNVGVPGGVPGATWGGGAVPAGDNVLTDFWNNGLAGGNNGLAGGNRAGGSRLNTSASMPSYSAFGGLPQPNPAPLPTNGGAPGLPGLSSIFGAESTFGGSASLGNEATGVWGASTATPAVTVPQTTTGASPWSMGGNSGSAMGGSAGSSSIW